MDIIDEKLVTKFLAGDDKSFEIITERYLKYIYNFIYQIVRDENISQDLTQDVFVKVWKNIRNFDSSKKFSTWIFAIAKNTAFDYLKKSICRVGMKKTLSFSFFENENGTNLLEYIEDENSLYSIDFWQRLDDQKLVEEFLTSIPPELRTILILHHYQQFSLNEVAEIMGCQYNTIKSKYRRVILFLRQKISSKNILSKVI